MPVSPAGADLNGAIALGGDIDGKGILDGIAVQVVAAESVEVGSQFIVGETLMNFIPITSSKNVAAPAVVVSYRAIEGEAFVDSMETAVARVANTAGSA